MMTPTAATPIVELNAFVVDILTEVRRLVGPTVQVELDLSVEPLGAGVDPDSLRDIVMQLCGNARDAMPAGGSLLIQTRQIALLPATSSGDPRPFSRLSVADTGCGIPPIQQPKVFERSFTTKAGRAGLGLTRANEAVQRHGGFLDFLTAIGAGTVFHVYLPGREKDD
jgi:signal transduction histidine kinase